MPTDTQVEFSPYQITYLPACAGGGEEVDEMYFTVRTVTRNNYTSVYRPLPSPPLWQSPTAYPKVDTLDQTWGKLHVPLYQSGSTCWPRQPVYKEKWQEVLAEGVKINFPGPLDWQTRMRLDIEDHAVNLGVSLVEYRQTARMFESFGRGMRDAWRAFRGRLPRRRRRNATPCNVAAAELTYSYGIEPLASDLYDSMVELQRVLEIPLIRRFVSTARDSDTFYLEPGDGEYTGSWSVSERAICYVEFEPNAQGGFTLGNPLELAWEVIPFSFVVDWALPIGDYLGALDSLKGTKKVTGTLTRKEVYHHYHKPLNAVINGYEIVRPATTDYNSFERTVVDSIPLPRVPRYDPSKSFRAITHGLSLLTTLNSGCNRGR